jgi:hypothetical protein
MRRGSGRCGNRAKRDTFAARKGRADPLPGPVRDPLARICPTGAVCVSDLLRGNQPEQSRTSGNYLQNRNLGVIPIDTLTWRKSHHTHRLDLPPYYGRDLGAPHYGAFSLVLLALSRLVLCNEPHDGQRHIIRQFHNDGDPDPIPLQLSEPER